MTGYSPELIEKQMLRVRAELSSTGPPSIKKTNLCLLVMCILSGAVGLVYLIFDPVVRSIVLSKLTLSKTSDTFYIWEDPPISPHLKVYFWNFTNPAEFFAGEEKPVLTEVGPYTYRQKWLKQNITWHENGTISYRTRKIFSFDVSESCEGCSDLHDRITTLNVPAISAYYQMRDAYWTGFILAGMIKGLDYNMWSTRSPHEFLWGHEEKLFEIARHTMLTPPPFDKFGFFLQRNTSSEAELGMYTMYTGEGDPYKLSTIASFNGQIDLGRWNDPECDRVHGSDGASFNPYIQQKDTLWFFNDQLCRAMPLVFDKEVNREGLPGYRFLPREEVFMSPERYPEQNSCFGGDDRVTGDGVFDVTICQFNAPIVLSWPHLLHAEPRFTDQIDGLRPDRETHGFWFDIQPTTGTTLSAKARIQINVMVRKSLIYEDLSLINDTLVPVLWFEEGIDELGEEIVKVLRSAAVDPDIYRQYVLYSFIVMLSMVLVLASVAATRLCIQKAKKMRDQMTEILGPDGDREQAGQPMLGHPDSCSTDSSRIPSTCHSRSCSEGTRPPYINDVTSDKLLDKLPQFVTRTQPYSTLQVGVPETLLDGVEQALLDKVCDNNQAEEEEEDEDDEEEEEEEEEEQEEQEEEEEEEEEGDDGMGATVVLLNTRHRITSTSFS